jgi:hypothetical protein
VGRAIRSETLEAETDLLRAQEDLTNSIALYIANVIKLESAASLEPGGSHLFSFRKGKGNSLLVEMKDSDFKYPDKGLNEMKNSKKLKNFLLDEEKID